MALDLALSLLVELALGVAHRQARNGNRLASPGIPLVWEMEESARRAGKQLMLGKVTLGFYLLNPDDSAN